MVLVDGSIAASCGSLTAGGTAVGSPPPALPGRSLPRRGPAIHGRLVHDGDMSELETNKAVVRRIYEEGYDRGEPEVFESLYAPGFIHHSKVIFDVRPGGLGELDSMRRFREAMPDVRFSVVDQLAEGDMVAPRLRITGHPVADYGTVSAADGAFEVNALALFRVIDGLVADE